PIITTPIYSIQYKQQIIDCFSGTGYLVNVSGLSFNQQRDLAQYLKQDTNNDPFDNSGTNCSNPQALAFAMEAIEAMNNESILIFSPFVKYPQDLAEQYKLDYPKLTEYLQNELPNLSNDNLIIEALEEYGSLTQQQIEEALIWGDLSSITLRIV